MTIDIAVPTYNCGLWIDDFINALIAQSCQDWRIVTRDDGSSDDTIAKVASWKARLGRQLLVLDNPTQTNLGMVGNYDAVLTACTADLVMLGDPDDVWKTGKISLCLGMMRAAEAKFGPGTPLIICTDAEVVDAKLQSLHPSFWKRARTTPAYVGRFSRMIMENPVLTSTMLMNRAVLSLALPMSGAGVHPDWWLALVTCSFGKIIASDEKTVLYRRHGTNDSSDPIARTLLGIALKFSKISGSLHKAIGHASAQARGFTERYASHANKQHMELAGIVGQLPDMSPWQRRLYILKYGLFLGSLEKTLGLLVFY